MRSFRSRTVPARFARPWTGLLLALLVGAALVPESRAQTRWQRTVEVIVPVSDAEVMPALLDSMDTVFRARGATVQRSPQSEPVPYDRVGEMLSGEGLSVSSASHVFITYRYALTSARLERQIQDLYFIYRSTSVEEDVPILYVDLTTSDLYEELLVERGSPMASNEATYLEFERQLSLHRLRDVATVVRVGDDIIRDSERATAEKQRILQVTTRLVHQ